MPNILKKMLRKYSKVKPQKVFPFRELENGDVCCALYATGRIEDSAPEKIKRKYVRKAGKDNLFIWKLPKDDKAKRLRGVIHQGIPSPDESFYNFIYVFQPEIYGQGVAEFFDTRFHDKEDGHLIFQAENLG